MKKQATAVNHKNVSFNLLLIYLSRDRKQLMRLLNKRVKKTTTHPFGRSACSFSRVSKVMK